MEIVKDWRDKPESRSCYIYYNIDNGKLVEVCFPTIIYSNEKVKEIFKDNSDVGRVTLGYIRKALVNNVKNVYPSMAIGYLFDVYINVPEVDIYTCSKGTHDNILYCSPQTTGGVYLFTIKGKRSEYVYDRLTGKIIEKPIFRSPSDFYSQRFVPIITNRDLKRLRERMENIFQAFDFIEKLSLEIYPIYKKVKEGKISKKKYFKMLEELSSRAVKEFFESAESEEEWLRRRIAGAFGFGIPLGRKE